MLAFHGGGHAGQVFEDLGWVGEGGDGAHWWAFCRRGACDGGGGSTW